MQECGYFRGPPKGPPPSSSCCWCKISLWGIPVSSNTWRLLEAETHRAQRLGENERSHSPSSPGGSSRGNRRHSPGSNPLMWGGAGSSPVPCPASEHTQLLRVQCWPRSPEHSHPLLPGTGTSPAGDRDLAPALPFPARQGCREGTSAEMLLWSFTSPGREGGRCRSCAGAQPSIPLHRANGVGGVLLPGARARLGRSSKPGLAAALFPQSSAMLPSQQGSLLFK